MRLAIELEKAYIAGIIDGEGSISARGRKWNEIVVVVTNSNTSLITLLQEIYGGHVVPIKQRSLGKTKVSKPVFQWRVYCDQVETLLNGVLPYLIVKKEHAIVALKLREIVKRNKSRQTVSQEDVKGRMLCAAFLSRLNETGVVISQAQANGPVELA